MNAEVDDTSQAMLDKLKYLKEVDFFEGTPLEEKGKREAWEKAEAKIAARYSKAAVYTAR